MAFGGFPEAALTFYDRLELENTREFWASAKGTYEDAVRAPMQALADDLAAEFGAAKIFRPHRDVRFRADKSPYKTHQGAFVRVGEALGYYVQVSSSGVEAGAGFYRASPERLAAFRSAVAGPAGDVLEGLLRTAAASGLELGGDTLKTTPRGYERDHPRIGLLRHKTLTLRRDHGFAPVIHTGELVDLVRTDWRATRPVVEWLDATMSS